MYPPPYMGPASISAGVLPPRLGERLFVPPYTPALEAPLPQSLAERELEAALEEERNAREYQQYLRDYQRLEDMQQMHLLQQKQEQVQAASYVERDLYLGRDQFVGG